METTFDHQDWKTIIVKSKLGVNKQPEKKVTVKKNKNNSNILSIEKKVEKDELKHKKIPDDLKIKIIQTRNSKKYTQKQLANMCNLPLNIINDIESGKAIYNHQHINKIKRTLKIS